MTNKTILKICRGLIGIISYTLLVNVIFMLGASYGEYKEPNQNLYEFILQPKEFTYRTYEEPPQQIKDFYRIVSFIWYLFILNMLKIFLDQKIEPENSFMKLPFFEKVKEQWRKLINEQDKL